ncbi:ATP-grasp domain-containing protein [Paenibacillus kobensis]|uniref:ATP-grasp domain-containing protein n=1 Tax=Paenibacillus kobensis TaxID=59841 RepID=UPI0013E3B274|nr:ATP-grasp domain-containing protein [Paenibacillus kobensis]
MDDKRPLRMIMIGGWTGIYQRARACGLEVTLVQEKDKVKPEDLAYIAELITSPLDDPAVLELIDILHRRQPYDAVVSFQEMGILTAAMLKERLNLPGNPLFPVLTTRDKAKMRAYMKEKQFPSVPFEIVSETEEVLRFIEEHQLPVILKPSYGTGSAQIYKITDTGQIAPALGLIQAAYTGGDILVEKFIEGREISVEGFTWNGKHTMIAVTDKFTTGAPNFVETGHNMPSSLPDSQAEEAKRLTEALMDLIGHQFGPSHTEIIVAEDGMYIVETHTRVGGDYIFEMVERVYGFDLFTQTFNGFLSGEPNLSSEFTGQAAAIRYLQLPPGEVAALDGVQEAELLPGVVRCQVDVQPGQRTKPFTKSMERNGFILAQGSTVQDAVETVEEAWSRIRIDVRPLPQAVGREREDAPDEVPC